MAATAPRGVADKNGQTTALDTRDAQVETADSAYIRLAQAVDGDDWRIPVGVPNMEVEQQDRAEPEDKQTWAVSSQRQNSTPEPPGGARQGAGWAPG